MVNSRIVEIWVGVFIALGLAALFMLAMHVSNLGEALERGGYTVTARFENISGLTERAPVTMAGVRIGRVSGIRFDPDTFEAVVSIQIDRRFDAIPDDTSASIYTSGLLGERYIGLEAGGSMTNLAPGDQIMLTQSSMILEQLIGQFLFSQASGDRDE